jgi:hypothetical protein
VSTPTTGQDSPSTTPAKKLNRCNICKGKWDEEVIGEHWYNFRQKTRWAYWLHLSLWRPILW